MNEYLGLREFEEKLEEKQALFTSPELDAADWERALRKAREKRNECLFETYTGIHGILYSYKASLALAAAVIIFGFVLYAINSVIISTSPRSRLEAFESGNDMPGKAADRAHFIERDVFMTEKETPFRFNGLFKGERIGNGARAIYSNVTDYCDDTSPMVACL